jgi:hypothetical protein
MSNYGIIEGITMEIRRRIHGALLSAPDDDFGLSTPETDITLSAPDDDLTGSPRLSLYLYHIEQDGHLRNQPRIANGPNGLRFPPISVQLRYLITPLDKEEDQNHLILGRILQNFHDNPVIESLNGVPLDNSFGANSPGLRIALETLTLEQLAQVWHAMDASYRLSIAYVVRIVAIDSAQGIIDAKRVMEAHTAVGLKQE